MKLGIVGFGHVGKAMNELFCDAIVYDEPKNIGKKEDINACQVVFICVPTPMGKDGECDTSVVESVLIWLKAPTIVIRSTVPVGFTDKWQNKKPESNVVFQPEYYGETVNHPMAKLSTRNWVTLGGENGRFDDIIAAYQQVYTSDIFFQLIDSKTAELAKYMENCYLATKVTFCNEFYDLAQSLGVDYNQLRETWLLDPRIGRSHTFVYNSSRGFGGSCLPKDLSALIKQAEDVSVDVTLMKSVYEKNEKIKVQHFCPK